MVLGIPQFKKPLFVVRSLATSTDENDPENSPPWPETPGSESDGSARVDATVSEETKPTFLELSIRIQQSFAFETSCIHLVESIRRHVDSIESFGRQTGGHAFSSSWTAIIKSEFRWCLVFGSHDRTFFCGHRQPNWWHVFLLPNLKESEARSCRFAMTSCRYLSRKKRHLRWTVRSGPMPILAASSS